MLGEERERVATRGDVDLLPPGRARAARVQLGRRVAAGEVEVGDADVAHAALGERAGDRRCRSPRRRRSGRALLSMAEKVGRYNARANGGGGDGLGATSARVPFEPARCRGWSWARRCGDAGGGRRVLGARYGGRAGFAARAGRARARRAGPARGAAGALRGSRRAGARVGLANRRRGGHTHPRGAAARAVDGADTALRRRAGAIRGRSAGPGRSSSRSLVGQALLWRALAATR